MTICIIGDSITWGARLPFRTAWANLLRNYLYNISEDSINVYDLGIDGDTTSDILVRFDTEMQARKPDIILIAAGVNDSVFRIKNGQIIREISEQKFEQNVKEIINKARKFTNKIFWVGLIKGDDKITQPLPRSTTGKCYNKINVQNFNKILKTVCKKEDIRFVDLFPYLNDTDFYDGLHPNEQGHIKIFEHVKRAIAPLITDSFGTFITIVNKNDIIIGYKKREYVNKQDITRVSTLWLINESQEILIKKRSYEKKYDPGTFGPYIATTLYKDETYISAITNNLPRSLESRVKNIASLGKIFIQNQHSFFCSVFMLPISKSDINVVKNYKANMQWIPFNLLKKKSKEHPQMFIQDIEKYIEIIEQKIK